MADIPLQFADIGNALAQGYHVRALREQSQESDRRKALAPDVQAAIGGDSGALGRIAGVDPDYALKIGPIMEAMDAKQRAKTQAGADYTYKAANAVLQADPASRPAIYQQMITEGRAQGHDLSRLPQQYTPGLEGQLRSWRQMAVPILEQWKREESQPVPMGGGAPAGGGAVSPDREKFVQTMTPHALAVSQATGLDPRLVLAQSALETGYGSAAPGNNYFGIKSHGAPGGQVLPTQEAGPGGMYGTNESFRTYADPGASAQDYAQFLKTNSRYAPVLAAKGLDAQIAAMGQSGYATDPNYAAKLRQIAQSLPPIGGPQPAPMPGPPGGIAPPVQTAQMPGPPQNLMPPGPPPAQMLGAPPQAAPRVPGPIAAPPTPAQGDTPQADASGTPLPQQGGPPPPPNEMLQEFVQRVRPGWTPMVDRVTRQPVYDHAGRLMVGGPNNARDTLAVPKQAEVPFGWVPDGRGGFMPAPGGPHDPATIKSQAEAKRKAEDGGVPGPFSPKSVEGSALNTLIADGTLTQNQAAQLAAGKTITNPADGSVIFMTPSGLFAKPPNGPAVPVQSTAPAGTPTAPAAAQQANPGMIPLTGSKPAKDVPVNTAHGMQENLNSLKQIDRALGALKATPDSVGWSLGNVAQRVAPETGGDINNSNDPAGVPLRALIADIGSMKIHDRSGGNVTVSETPRLIPFIPKITDSPETLRNKLANFRAAYSQILEDTLSFYNPENGFKEYTPAVNYLKNKAAEPGPAEKARDDFNTKKVGPPTSLKLPPKIQEGATATNPQTGERIIFKGGQWSPAQ